MRFQQLRELNIPKMFLGIIIWCFTLSTSFSEGVQSQCTFNKLTGFVNCRNKNLTSVPSNLPAEAKIVDLSNNKIQKLEKTAFKNSLFITELYLANNNVSSLNYGVFGFLKSLKILDVSNNSLSHFHVDLPVSLEILYLDGNPLSNDNIFQQRMLFIRYLSLARTKLTKPSIFSSFLPVLQYLDLQEIPSLSLTPEDLHKLRHLSILYVSPRMFSGRVKSQNCREFIKASKQYKIEVKAFTCFPEETFEIKGRMFERVYQVDEAMYDYPDNILNELEDKNETCLHSLQILVSNGMTNFIKSILVERKQEKTPSYKIREPLVLENFYIENPQIGLYNVNMTGYPVLKMKNEPLISFSSVDAEEIKRFKVQYITNEVKRDIQITGNFNFYDSSGTFSCKFTNTNYETTRQMIRRYDFRIWPTHIREKLQFEKMDCSTSLSNNYIDKIIDMVLTALSKSWLNSVTNVANAVAVEPSIVNISDSFSDMYRKAVLRKLIREGEQYLKNLNVSSFDVSPTSYSSNETAVELDLTNNIYNIKIENLFNYQSNDLQYTTSNAEPDTLKFSGKYVVNYDSKSAAVVIISAKENPNDVVNIAINSIEFTITFEAKSLNRVQKLDVLDVNVKIEEKESQRTNFIFTLLKKYLGVELAKEFKRSLIFLIDKVDFYSLNVM